VRANARLGRIADVAPVAGGSRTDRLAGRTERPGLIVILQIHLPAQVDLLDVRQAAHLAGLLARLGKDGKEDRRQYSDDRNNDKQLDERKTPDTSHERPPVGSR